MKTQENNIIEYIEEGYLNSNNCNTNDLEYYITQGENEPEINYKALEEAANGLFGDKKAMSLKQYLQVTKDFYETLDLEKRGTPSLILDTDLLLESFIRARDDIISKITKDQRTDKVLVIGCGEGRLSSLYIEMAKKLGIKKITFNDLLEKHIEQTKKKLQKVYNTGTLDSNEMSIDGIKVEFLPGDFTTIDLQGSPYDITVAWWFVTSEIFNPNSPKELRQKRIEFYTKVRTNLIRKGIFIEDIPHSVSSGFYFLSRMKTFDILKRKGILVGEQKNLSLTNIPKKDKNAQPYHLRYLPYNGMHTKEMNASGLYEVDSRSEIIPTQSVLTGDVDHLLLFENKPTILDVQMVIKYLIKTVTIPTGKVPQRKKITLWTNTQE